MLGPAQPGSRILSLLNTLLVRDRGGACYPRPLAPRAQPPAPAAAGPQPSWGRRRTLDPIPHVEQLQPAWERVSSLL